MSRHLPKRDSLPDNIRDEHLDHLIRLALQLEEAQEVQALLETPPEEPTPQQAARIMDAARAGMALLEQRQRDEARRALRRRNAMHAVQIAACLILAAALAAPIALAASPALRRTVQQLMIRFDERQQQLNVTTGPQKPYLPDVTPLPPEAAPAAWQGLHYPATMLPGFTLTGAEANLLRFEKDGSVLQFMECHAGMPVSLLDGLTAFPVDCGGAAGTLYRSTGTDYACLVWEQDESTMALQSTGVADFDLLQVARGVTHITGREAISVSAAPAATPAPSAEPAQSAALTLPRLFTGLNYPTWLPAGFELDIDRQWGVTFAGDYFRSADYREQTVIFTDADFATGQEAEVNGAPAFILHDPELSSYEVCWNIGDRGVSVRTVELPLSDALAIARSVQPLPPQQEVSPTPVIPAPALAPAADLPEEWSGLFFPARLPQGVQFGQVDWTEDGFGATFMADRGSIAYSESDQIGSLPRDEVSVTTHTTIGGFPATVRTSPNGMAGVLWQMEGTWVKITSHEGFTAEELVDMAMSTGKLPDELVSQRRALTIGADGVPTRWHGCLYPRQMPSDAVLTKCSRFYDIHAAIYTCGAGQLTFTEYAADYELTYFGDDMIHTEIPLGGATAMQGVSIDGSVCSLLWHTEDRLLMLESVDCLGPEELMQLALSVAPLQKK